MKTFLIKIALTSLGVLIFYLWLRMPRGLKGVVFFWVFPLLGLWLMIGGLISFFDKDED